MNYFLLVKWNAFYIFENEKQMWKLNSRYFLPYFTMLYFAYKVLLCLPLCNFVFEFYTKIQSQHQKDFTDDKLDFGFQNLTYGDTFERKCFLKHTNDKLCLKKKIRNKLFPTVYIWDIFVCKFQWTFRKYF